jgi:hypothetical protein
MNPHIGPARPHSKDELALIVPAVDEGLDHIQAVRPQIAEMVRRSLSVITIAKGDDGGGWSSMSARRIVGLMTLGNLQALPLNGLSPDQRIHRLAAISDSIVHEAIHSLIYRIELFDSFYEDNSAVLFTKAISPWSGRELNLHSFVHACFVWFGLWHFWSLSAITGVDYAPYLERARRGFLKGDLASLLSVEALPMVRPHVRSVIQEMFAQVQRSAPAS